jgi:anti-sigma factor RsiW
MSAETTMRCEDVAPYLSAFADGELPEPLRSEVAEHVETCDACSATLTSYAQIDILLAGLPRSAPSPELLDQILATVAAEDEQEERRQAVRSVWGLSSLKRRVTELDMPTDDRAPIIRARPTHRSRWVSVAIPAIAALLLISVTLVTFRWLPNKGTILPPTQQSTPTSAPGSVTLDNTRAAVNAIAAQLAFKPILPTYLPDGAILADVTLGPQRDSEVADHYLDIYWSVTGSVHMIHLHEAPVKVGLVGYTDLATPNQVAWQIGNAPWTPIRVDAAPKNMAIGQHRAGVSIALDASVAPNSSQAAAGQTMLRLISLSMDSRYLAMPAAPDAGTARILPLSIEEMVAHYSAVALNGNGAVAWRTEVYVAPCLSTADPCQVSKSYALGANGATLYTDIASGQRLLHLDKAQQTFTWLPWLPADQGASLNNTAMPKLFYMANTYLSTGILWYLNETSYKGQRVFDLLWTNAPTRTHVYVSKESHQVVAMVVDKGAKIQTGGPIAGTGSLSCIRYTMIEYVTPDTSTDAQFAQNIPTGFIQSQEPLVSLSC